MSDDQLSVKDRAEIIDFHDEPSGTDNNEFYKRVAYSTAIVTYYKYFRMEDEARDLLRFIQTQKFKKIKTSEIRLARICLNNAIRVRQLVDLSDDDYDTLQATEYIRHMKNFMEVTARNGFALATPS